MDGEQVIEKILSDARAEAEKIKSESEANLSREQGRLDEQLAKYGKETEELAKQKGKEKKAHMLAAARMEISKEYLAEKRRILEDVFEKASAQIKQLPDEEYLKIMSKLMIEAVETGDEEVVVGSEETRIDHEFIKMVNRKLGPGFKGNLRLSEEKENIGGGFTLRRGKIKNNVSLDVLLEQGRKELEIELAKDLFEN